MPVGHCCPYCDDMERRLTILETAILGLESDGRFVPHDDALGTLTASESDAAYELGFADGQRQRE